MIKSSSSFYRHIFKLFGIDALVAKVFIFVLYKTRENYTRTVKSIP